MKTRRWRRRGTPSRRWLFLTLLVASPSGAQESVASDRPGLGFSTRTVAPGFVQGELGAPDLDFAGAASGPSVAFPLALRAGVAGPLEARVGTVWVTAANHADPDGLAGLRLGIKVDVPVDAFDLVAIPEVVLPVGPDGVSPPEPVWSLNLAAGMPLAGSAGLTLVAGALLEPSEDGGHEPGGALAAVVGAPVAGPIAAYVEAGAYPRSGGDPAYAGAGLILASSRSLQLDGWVQVGLSDASADVRGGIGVAFLIKSRR